MEVYNDELHQYLDRCREFESNLQLKKKCILQVIDDITKVITREDPRFVGDVFCKESLRGIHHEGHQLVVDMSINALKVSNSECMSSKLDSVGMYNRSFSYSEKESQSNDTLLHFVEFSNVHNRDISSNATRSTSRIKMYKNNARSRLFCRIAERSINFLLQSSSCFAALHVFL